MSEWDNPADPTSGRYFRGTQRVVDRSDDEYNADVVVEIWGAQTPDGTVRRHVDVAEGGYERLTFSSVAHVRAFGKALIAAADEVDEMASLDPVGGTPYRS